jgi:hypothetical protein
MGSKKMLPLGRALMFQEITDGPMNMTLSNNKMKL